jgi:hypothetical protein
MLLTNLYRGCGRLDDSWVKSDLSCFTPGGTAQAQGCSLAMSIVFVINLSIDISNVVAECEAVASRWADPPTK